MSIFSNNLRFLRIQKGLNLDEFEFLGIKKGTMSNYELGKTEPKFDVLLELSKFFGISVDSFLTTPLEGNNTKTNSINLNGNLNGNPNGNLNSPFLQESGKTKSTNIVSLPIPVEPDEELVSVPLVDISVAAGTGFNNPTYMEEIDS